LGISGVLSDGACPRQRVVAWLGEMDEAGRLGVERVAGGTSGYQQNLFKETEPEWVEIDVKRVRVENVSSLEGHGWD